MRFSMPAGFTSTVGYEGLAEFFSTIESASEHHLGGEPQSNVSQLRYGAWMPSPSC